MPAPSADLPPETVSRCSPRSTARPTTSPRHSHARPVRARRPEPAHGWSRAHVVAHLTNVADALVRMTHDALADRPTTMYPGGHADRDAQIHSVARRVVGRAPHVVRAGRRPRSCTSGTRCRGNDGGDPSPRPSSAPCSSGAWSACDSPRSRSTTPTSRSGSGRTTGPASSRRRVCRSASRRSTRYRRRPDADQTIDGSWLLVCDDLDRRWRVPRRARRGRDRRHRTDANRDDPPTSCSAAPRPTSPRSCSAVRTRRCSRCRATPRAPPRSSGRSPGPDRTSSPARLRTCWGSRTPRARVARSARAAACRTRDRTRSGPTRRRSAPPTRTTGDRGTARAPSGRHRGGGSSARPWKSWCTSIAHRTSSRTYGRRISAAIRGWLGTLTALPMSWQSDATTSSSSAPARSASVAVCRQCVSWSTANPSTTSSRLPSMPSTRSAMRPRFAIDSRAMTPHSSAVDWSMRVNVARWLQQVSWSCPLFWRTRKRRGQVRSDDWRAVWLGSAIAVVSALLLTVLAASLESTVNGPGPPDRGRTGALGDRRRRRPHASARWCRPGSPDGRAPAPSPR